MGLVKRINSNLNSDLSQAQAPHPALFVFSSQSGNESNLGTLHNQTYVQTAEQGYLLNFCLKSTLSLYVSRFTVNETSGFFCCNHSHSVIVGTVHLHWYHFVGFCMEPDHPVFSNQHFITKIHFLPS